MLFKKYYWVRYTAQHTNGRTSHSTFVCDGHPLLAIQKLQDETPGDKLLVDNWKTIPYYLYLTLYRN